MPLISACPTHPLTALGPSYPSAPPLAPPSSLCPCSSPMHLLPPPPFCICSTMAGSILVLAWGTEYVPSPAPVEAQCPMMQRGWSLLVWSKSKGWEEKSRCERGEQRLHDRGDGEQGCRREMAGCRGQRVRGALKGQAEAVAMAMMLEPKLQKPSAPAPTLMGFLR